MTSNVATINLVMLAPQAKPTTYKIYQTAVVSSPGDCRLWVKQKRTWRALIAMAALTPITDIRGQLHVDRDIRILVLAFAERLSR